MPGGLFWRNFASLINAARTEQKESSSKARSMMFDYEILWEVQQTEQFLRCGSPPGVDNNQEVHQTRSSLFPLISHCQQSTSGLPPLVSLLPFFSCRYVSPLLFPNP
jgi:hypothetical protein